MFRTEANEDSTNKESTDSTLDPAAAPSGDSGRPGKTGGTPAVSRLGLDDESIMMEEKSACALSEDRLRIVWVVNSENYIYKRNSLNRARQVSFSFHLFAKILYKLIEYTFNKGVKAGGGDILISIYSNL